MPAPPPVRTDVPFNDEEYYDDALELPDVSHVQALAKTAFGVRYADMWIDRSVSPSVYRVGVVNATPSDAEKLSSLTGDNPRITVVGRAYSIDQLEQYEQTIFDIVRSRGNLQFGLGAYPVVGKVVVEVTPLDPTLASDIEAAGVPADAFTIALGGGGTLVHASRWEWPPFEGGLGVEIFPDGCPDCPLGGSCTTAFTMIATDGIQKGVTAGHCDLYANNVVWMDLPPERVSTPGLNSYYSPQPINSDAVRFYIPPSAKTNRIYVAGTGVHRILKSPRYLSSALVAGTRLCFQGITSGNNNCGEVNRGGAYFTDQNGVQHEHVWTINFPAFKGDSGGPVYGVRSDGSAKAAGIVSAKWLATDGSIDMAFHTIGYVIQDIDADLYYG